MLPSALRNEEPAQLSDRFSERGCDVGRSTAASRAISPERTLRWEQEPVTASHDKAIYWLSRTQAILDGDRPHRRRLEDIDTGYMLGALIVVVVLWVAVS
jgi:hypothetical protein